MIFELTPAHIEALNDTDLRTLIGYLAESEVTNAGYSAATVTYGGHQNAKDGGIDVRVSLENGTIDGYVPRSQTGFQAKAEDFAPADIKKEMRPNGKLRESIIALSEENGAYIIISSKGSVSDTALKSRKKAMADAIADISDTKSLFVDFYDKRRIASWVNQRPGIIAWVRDRTGQPISGWRPFQDWSSSPSGEDAPYILDGGVRLVSAQGSDDGLGAEEGIERLRAILREPKGVVRLVGLSGVGKTRMVQALFDDRIGSSPLNRRLAVYADIGDSLDPVPAELLSRIQSADQRCILIVDNCGADLHRKLASRLSDNSKVSIITVEYDISDDEPENTDVFKLIPASKEVIEKILEPRYPDLTGPEIRTIADFSEGNFRIALALANTAKDGQSLANMKDVDLFNRLFRQKNEDNPALLRAAKVCSLVYSFDVETVGGDEVELPLLAGLADQTASEFHAHVAELKRRQLVQARSRWRALLPHALAHRLARLALEDIPGANINAFTDAAFERLLKSFSRRLGCLHDHTSAQKIAADWLAPGGKIAAIGQLNDLGMVVLDNIAPVNPEAVLKSIASAATQESDFFDANPNMQRLVRLLRSLAYEPAMFSEATELIARFARLKTKSNNTGDAINVFKSLFYIMLSGTHAPARMRADYIRALAQQADETQQTLVMEALDAMLECSHFSSSYGFEFGTRKRDYGFHAKTWGEHFDWYAEAFLLSRDLAAIPTFRNRVRSMIASQFRFLAGQVRLDDLVALAESFAADGGWPEGWAGTSAALRQAKKIEGNTAIIRRLTTLERSLSPHSLSHRITSYVLPEQWSALDLADFDPDDENRHDKMNAKINEVCGAIGAELVEDDEKLRAYLPTLLESSSNRVLVVAQAVGRTAPDPQATWETIEEIVLASKEDDRFYTFPGGFLGGLAKRDRAAADKFLDAAAADPRWHIFLPHMQLSVGLDIWGSKRLISIMSSPDLPVWTLHNLAWGRSTDDLSGTDFTDLLTAIAQKEGGTEPAIEILYMRLYTLRSEKKFITEDERKIARHLLEQFRFSKDKRREPHKLATIIRDCLSDPEDALFARNFCQRLLSAMASYTVSPYDYSEVVTELAGKFPRVVLEEALEADPADGNGRRGLFGTVRDNRPCALRKIDDDVMLKWAHEKPETRFTALASEMLGWRGAKAEQNPETLADDDDITGLKWTPAALRLIHEAPDPIAVLDAFASHFHPMGWSGSLADILEGRQSLLDELGRDSDARIVEWANTAAPKLADQIGKQRRWEAKQDRERDERFDW